MCVYGQMLQSAAQSVITRSSFDKRSKRSVMRGSSAAARMTSVLNESSTHKPDTRSRADDGAASRNASTVVAGCLYDRRLPTCTNAPPASGQPECGHVDPGHESFEPATLRSEPLEPLQMHDTASHDGRCEGHEESLAPHDSRAPSLHRQLSREIVDVWIAPAPIGEKRDEILHRGMSTGRGQCVDHGRRRRGIETRGTSSQDAKNAVRRNEGERQALPRTALP
jgi:hypothetical protein